jgi:cell division protease FtsH
MATGGEGAAIVAELRDATRSTDINGLVDIEPGVRIRLRMAIAAGYTVFFAIAVSPQTAQAAATFAPPQSASSAFNEATYTGLLRALDHHAVRSATVDENQRVAKVVYRDGRHALVRYPSADTTLPVRMAKQGAVVRIAGESSPFLKRFLAPLFMVLVLAVALGIGVALRRTGARRDTAADEGWDAGSRAGLAPAAAGRRADLAPVDAPATRFSDVAGCDEAVDELAEIVEFLRTPERFARVDARMPAGLLLTGPPGTGKTMLARALAGEAGVRFYAASGSQFMEKFVGVGASRIRELFKRATDNAPAVIFIDEIDAVGASRSGHDGNGERDQTLNELLVRMDGFSTSNRVVVVAATNRPDILDPALLRPGRFSRQISVGLPSEEGRRAILGVHSASKPLTAGVDLGAIAATTGGFSGAQLAELLNEAAIMAARDGRETIENDDVREGLRRVLAGPKRKSAPIAEGELEKIAYHEAGHVVCAEMCEHHANAQHVTIDPRGNAMGFALFGHEDRALHDEEHLHEAMIAALGGRAAEQLVFGRVSSGAKNDLEKVNAIARAAVTEYGMSPRIGQLVGDERRFSDETRALIDREVERLVAAAYADALALLEARRHELNTLAARLLDTRELERVDIVTALTPAPSARDALAAAEGAEAA